MTALAQSAPAPYALQQLHDHLAVDMAGVNATILEYLQSDIALIPQVGEYLIRAGGKRLRPLLTVASARLCGDTSDLSHALAAAVEFIHSASLLHDDVVDESAQRRGQPSANDAFGNQTSVLVGDFLFARSFELMVKTGDIKILDILSKAAATITEGEVLQLSLAGNITTTDGDYFRVIGAKTAALFSAATECGAILGGRPEQQPHLRDYGYHLGMAFQLIDDLLDYNGGPDLNKNIGDDLREGKLTLPVILAIRAGDSEEKDFWQTALSGEADHTMFARAHSLMVKHRVFDAVRTEAQKQANLAKAALGHTAPHPLRDLLIALLDDVIERRK